jgi:hypothetical protein
LLTTQCAYTTFRYEPDYDGCGIRFIDKNEGIGTRTWDFGDGFTKTIAGDAHKQSNLSSSKSYFPKKSSFFFIFTKRYCKKNA